MSSSSTDLALITNTLTNLKRLISTEMKPESSMKRVCESTSEMNSTSAEETVPVTEKKAWSSFLKPSMKSDIVTTANESKTTEEGNMSALNQDIMESCEGELKTELQKERFVPSDFEKEGVVSGTEEEVVKIFEPEIVESKEVLMCSSVDEIGGSILDVEECSSMDVKECSSVEVKECPSVIVKEDPPIEVKECPSVEAQPCPPVETQPCPSINAKEPPTITRTSKYTTPSSETPKESLSIEQKMEHLLEEMDKELPIHQDFKPPSPIKSSPLPIPSHSSLSISHFVFVYIPHRGCTDRIRLLISYLTHGGTVEPPIHSSTLSIPNFMEYMRDKQLPPMIIPILEIHTGTDAPMLLFHDEAIFSYLIQTYHLMAEEPEKQILEENIESTAQFIYHELWWYQHATEVESSDSQKIKMKKQFISNVLFPSLQLINSCLFKLHSVHRNNQEEKGFESTICSSDFSVISLLSAIEDPFGVIIDLFIELKEYYLELVKREFVVSCNRY